MWKIPQSNDITKKTIHIKPDIDSCSSLTESKTDFYSFPSNAVIVLNCAEKIRHSKTQLTNTLTAKFLDNLSIFDLKKTPSLIIKHGTLKKNLNNHIT